MDQWDSKYYWRYRHFKDGCDCDICCSHDGSIDKVAIWDIPENKELYRKSKGLGKLLKELRALNRRQKINKLLEVRN